MAGPARRPHNRVRVDDSLPEDPTLHNLLLSALPETERNAVLDGAELIFIEAGEVLVRPGQRLDHAWFPESGICSMVAAAGGRELEVGMIGRDGFVEAMWAQASYTAVSNARDSIGQRLARRLLMCRDRADSDEIALTHNSLASTLGVQRPGVTLALHELEGAGMIRAHRARITIRDRETLERVASCYGMAEAEYRRLIGVAVRQ
jgi:CRP-like cAMP-binding protein